LDKLLFSWRYLFWMVKRILSTKTMISLSLRALLMQHYQRIPSQSENDDSEGAPLDDVWNISIICTCST
jgi:hypothetical protein